jgi:hypothetical protein
MMSFEEFMKQLDAPCQSVTAEEKLAPSSPKCREMHRLQTNMKLSPLKERRKKTFIAVPSPKGGRGVRIYNVNKTDLDDDQEAERIDKALQRLVKRQKRLSKKIEKADQMQLERFEIINTRINKKKDKLMNKLDLVKRDSRPASRIASPDLSDIAPSLIGGLDDDVMSLQDFKPEEKEPETKEQSL